MIEIKTLREIELLREAGRIVALCHQKMQEVIKPGITTLELDRICEKIIRDNGATPSCKGYEGYQYTICTSVNEVVIHGIPNNRKLKNGDIVDVDICACYKGYHGDSAYTYYVGKISKEDEKLCEVTKEALYEGLSKIKDGAFLGDVSNAIQSYVQEFGYSVVEEYGGHGVGRNLHEEPDVLNYGEAGTGPILREGMVIAVEPMINMGKKDVRTLNDGWTTVTKDGKKSAHYEHTIVVTKEGYDILTKL